MSHRSIESHLEDFESKLRGPNRTEKHIKYTLQFIHWIAAHAGFKTAADISADAVNRYAGKLRDQERAARTIQAHLNAMKAFTKWLTEHHKLPRDHLAINFAKDLRHFLTVLVQVLSISIADVSPVSPPQPRRAARRFASHRLD